MRWVLTPYRRYFDFTGRSIRTEFWTFLPLWLAVLWSLRTVDSQLLLMDNGPLRGVFIFVTLVPALAVTVRRLHDANRTGWWVLLPFTAIFLALIAIPLGAETHDVMSLAIGVSVFLGPLALLVLLAWKGTRGPNRFGADPRNPDADLEAVFS
ncbi:DUF805 domain-containing protein [Sphingomonas sp.]|uniref:DUF805 domain-containing protein n=1 Tax=Sphingomonas sp. TaxID=28214 RepID=UPI0031E21565